MVHQSLDTLERAVTEIGRELGKSRSKPGSQDCYGKTVSRLLGKMRTFLALIFGQEGPLKTLGSDFKRAVS